MGTPPQQFPIHLLWSRASAITTSPTTVTPEPAADIEPEPAAIKEPEPKPEITLELEPIMSDQVCEPATSPMPLGVLMEYEGMAPP